MQPLVFLTGGGTAGHVTPNLALVPLLSQKGYRIGYIGRKNSIEEQLAKGAALPFYPIHAGRLHRDFNLENWVSPLQSLWGTAQAARLIRREQPAVILCKGGFVSVPVALAGHMQGVPVILHESDMTPGLANRLCLPAADVVCTGFEETLGYLPHKKAIYTGTPVRGELLGGSAEEGRRITGLQGRRPVVLIMGGSSGAGAINAVVGPGAAYLTERYQIVHLCGRKQVQGCEPRRGYFPMAYAGKELPHLYALADIVVSRAGANALAEILLLKKPNILIPLPKAVSRGDQILNATSFAGKGYSYVLPQEELTVKRLRQALDQVYAEREGYRRAMINSKGSEAAKAVLRVIERAAAKSK